jgi:hypothetical protein
MRMAFMKMFSSAPRSDSDRATFDRIFRNQKLRSCLSECRRETGRVFLSKLWVACQ